MSDVYMTCVWFFLTLPVFCFFVFVRGNFGDKNAFLIYIYIYMYIYIYIFFFFSNLLSLESKGEVSSLRWLYLCVTNKLRHFVQLLGRLPVAGLPWQQGLRASCVGPKPSGHMAVMAPHLSL